VCFSFKIHSPGHDRSTEGRTVVGVFPLELLNNRCCIPRVQGNDDAKRPPARASCPDFGIGSSSCCAKDFAVQCTTFSLQERISVVHPRLRRENRQLPAANRQLPAANRLLPRENR